MNAPNDSSEGLTRWTPEIAAEVRRTQVLWISITVGVLVAFSMAFGLLVDPKLGGIGGTVGMRMLLLLAALIAPCIALILAVKLVSAIVGLRRSCVLAQGCDLP